MPYYFELPDITKLTPPQQAVLNDPGSVSVYGGPGTGKSITSLWRHIRNYDTGTRKSMLLTYTMPLVAYLAGAARPTSRAAAANVQKTLWWLQHEARPFEEIIVDEAQDLPESTYEQLKRYSNSISYGADDQQIVYNRQPTTEKQLKGLFPDTTSHPLDENFRNSYEILRFVKAALPEKVISQNMLNTARADRTTGVLPRVLVTNYNNQKQYNAVIELIGRFYSSAHNIGVIMPFPDDVDDMYSWLTDNRITCSKYHNGEHVLPVIENVHVTTYASAKGIEFDTVIVPQFEKMRSYMKTKYAATENHYYVTFTRAKMNLFLISTTKPNDIDARTFETDLL